MYAASVGLHARSCHCAVVWQPSSRLGLKKEKKKRGCMLAEHQPASVDLHVCGAVIVLVFGNLFPDQVYAQHVSRVPSPSTSDGRGGACHTLLSAMDACYGLGGLFPEG
jgi:hypothetical protein